MDLQRLHYFLAVMEHQNLSTAAQLLRVSQPTLSRQMRALEREFGTPLFVRAGRGIEPTEAAKRLSEGFKGLERQLRSLKSEVASASDQPSGEVAFGIPPSPRTLLAVPLIGRFAKAFPNVMVRVTEETSGQVSDQIAGGMLDLAVTNIHEPVRGVTAEPLGREQMLLIGPPDSKLTRRASIAIEDLGDVPLILTTRPNSLRLFVETRLARIGRKTKICIEANTLPLMTDLVMARLGHTVLPSCGVRELLKKKLVSACPVEGFYITWLIAQPKSRPLSFAALQLARVLREIADEQIAKKIWEPAEMTTKDAEGSAGQNFLTGAE